VSDYTRHLAELRGIIEARDIRPGDTIKTWCAGGLSGNAARDYKEHTVESVHPQPGMVTLVMVDGCIHKPHPSIPATLVSLAESTELTAWKIGGAL
jgi:hypothetical protein